MVKGIIDRILIRKLLFSNTLNTRKIYKIGVVKKDAKPTIKLFSPSKIKMISLIKEKTTTPIYQGKLSLGLRITQ
jgi:hypothetical protein